MHIKTINTKGEYQCIIVGHNNPVQVDRRKGYWAIYWLGFFMPTFRVDNIYPDVNYGGSQELLLLVLQLILVIRRAAHYIVMTGLDSDGIVALAMILFAACPDTTPWLSSIIYLLRCPALISFFTKNFRLWHLSVS